MAVILGNSRGSFNLSCNSIQTLPESAVGRMCISILARPLNLAAMSDLRSGV